MNIFRKYTLKSLWQNKTRTLVTIVGIILSVAMITAVTTTVSSLQNYMLEVVRQDSGSWHSSIYGPDHDELQKILSKEGIDKKAVLAAVEYSKLDNVKSERTPYLYIGGFSGDFAELLTVDMKEGRLPENSSELILPSDMFDRSGIQYKVGDSIQLETGIREHEESGEIMWQDWPYDPETEPEKFISRGEKTYHIVGIYDSAQFGYWGNSTFQPGYPALTRLDDKISVSEEMIFMTLDDPDEISSFEDKLEKEFNEDGTERLVINRNNNYLRFLGKGIAGGLGAMLKGMIIILIGIIMFGSVALICNSFAISVNERKKQYGLLSSIGATRKQLRRSVLFEAVLVSLVGVPLGVLAGIGGIGVTFYCLRDTFAVFLGTQSRGIEIHVSAAMWSVVLAAVVGFITVLISAWLPARKALKINVIDAIRQTTDIMIKPKKLKTSLLTRKLFGLEGVLASKNYKRNKRKYRATVFSLFISVVLFISASSFSDYLSTGLNDMLHQYDCDLRYTEIGVRDEAEKLYNDLSQVSGVTEHNYHYGCWEGIVSLPARYLSERILQDEVLIEKSTEDGTLEQSVDFRGTILVFIPDDEYENYLKKNKLDVSRYMNAKEPTALIFDYNTPIWSSEEQRYVYSTFFESNPGSLELSYEVWPEEEEDDELEEDWEESEPIVIGKKRVSVGDIRREKLAGYEEEQDGRALLAFPASAVNSIVPKDVAVEYVMTFKAKDPKKTAEIMQEIVDENGGGFLFNVAEEIKVARAIMLILNIFSYGFILLISLIASANVFNTISTNVFLRRREFAMLRSVGMTKKSFHKMSNFECLLYGVKGLMYGLPVAVGITALIWYAMSQEIAIGFYIPWYSIAIAVGSVFLVVFATMLYSMGKIRKDNVVETLKEENY